MGVVGYCLDCCFYRCIVFFGLYESYYDVFYIFNVSFFGEVFISGLLFIEIG